MARRYCRRARASATCQPRRFLPAPVMRATWVDVDMIRYQVKTARRQAGVALGFFGESRRFCSTSFIISSSSGPVRNGVLNSVSTDQEIAVAFIPFSAGDAAIGQPDCDSNFLGDAKPCSQLLCTRAWRLLNQTTALEPVQIHQGWFNSQRSKYFSLPFFLFAILFYRNRAPSPCQGCSLDFATFSAQLQLPHSHRKAKAINHLALTSNLRCKRKYRNRGPSSRCKSAHADLLRTARPMERGAGASPVR